MGFLDSKKYTNTKKEERELNYKETVINKLSKIFSEDADFLVFGKLFEGIYNEKDFLKFKFKDNSKKVDAETLGLLKDYLTDDGSVKEYFSDKKSYDKQGASKYDIVQGSASAKELLPYFQISDYALFAMKKILGEKKATLNFKEEDKQLERVILIRARKEAINRIKTLIAKIRTEGEKQEKTLDKKIY